MRGYVIAACSAVLVLTVAGCNGGEAPDKAKPSPAVKPLSKTWTPKIEKAQQAPEDVCADSGSAECADHITDIVIAVYGLRDAIEEKGLEDRYPRATKRIAKIDRASTDYSKHECKDDPNADVKGSPCTRHVADIVAGSASLLAEMATDEAKAAG